MRNKVIVALGIALLSIAGNVRAQDVPVERTRERLYFGLKAGINRSNVWDAEGQDFKADARTGFAGGAFVSIPLIQYLGIQPEILISQKGYQSSGTFLGNFYSNTRTTTYLDIPILFALKPSPMFTILAGPEYSYLIHQTDVTRFGPTSTATEKDFQNENARKNIFGLIGGLDLNFKHVVVSGRAGWDLSKNNGDGTSTTPRYRNQWLQFTVGFRI